MEDVFKGRLTNVIFLFKMANHVIQLFRKVICDASGTSDAEDEGINWHYSIFISVNVKQTVSES
ncbi:hypothetical protein T02_3503 [Trichinella nativa]|uniref:Uncharacterized protein n=1 Tax=Trichinella nativa TaxID=6335 RepID=A0A0V1L380_9BILA|nr:hypothetical protein T02_3503 [Trichinella nativa]